MDASDYRADIDGLRSFAIVPVVLYHAGVSSLPGGFVGVDVFFVISGYLISKHIYADLERGDFSVTRFYERRARRLLPAFFTASFLAVVAGYFLLFPEQFSALAKSLIWSTLFAGNIHFWLAVDYFGPAAETMPLLHYWSLGVEEQFYFLFPWLALVLLKGGRGILIAGLLAVTAISLVASQIMVSIQPETAFFLLPFRAWEMLVGSILAVRGMPSLRNATVAGLVVCAGIALILAAVFTFSSSMAFPGAAAVVPVLGAALVLWGGQIRNKASTAIGSEPLAYIGRISYSLYLVHWPVIVFAHRLFPEASWGWTAAGTAAVSFVIASMIFHLVETPTRNRQGFWTVPRVFAHSAVGMASAVVAGAVILAGSGWPSRYPEAVQRVLAYRYDRKADYRDHVCLLDAGQRFDDLAEDECLPRTGNVAVLWGDSLAAHLVLGIRPLIERAGYQFAQATASACPPLLGVEKATRPNCRQFNDDVYRWLSTNKPRVVLISGTWGGTTAETRQLRKQIAELKKLGIAVVVLGPGARFIDRVPHLIADRMVRNQPLEVAGNLHNRAVAVDHRMERAVAANTPYISVLKASCPAGICPLMDADGTPLYWDQNHLTDAGSRAVARLIQDQLASALKVD